jgi:hypothetical protein
MRAQAIVVGAVVACLVGCGGSKPLTNESLASDLSSTIGKSSTTGAGKVVCWQAVGKLGNQSAMGYDHICGISRTRPSLYVRTGVKGKPGWCLVTPRLNVAPDCPL